MKFRDILENKSTENATENATEQLNEEVRVSLQNIVNSLTYASHVAQTAHWNLRSSSFVAVHPWLGETYSKLALLADEVAEQIKIADINLMVNVNSTGTSVQDIDEQSLFLSVQESLDLVKAQLDTAANDETLSRVLQNLIDGWTAEITKMQWFIKASLT